MRTYCASTLPFSPFQLREFVGGLSQNGVSAIELAQAHFSRADAETIAALREETGLRFKSMLSTVAVDAPGGLEALIEILDTAQGLSIPLVSIASGGKEEATAREIATIIDHLKTVTEEAQTRNLTLMLYAHEGSMAYNLERTQHILNAISAENFGFYYSPYHFHRAGGRSGCRLAYLIGAVGQCLFQLWCGFKHRQRAVLGTRDGFSRHLSGDRPASATLRRLCSSIWD